MLPGFSALPQTVSAGSSETGCAVLTNSSGAYGRAISEHVIMVSLMLLRRIPEYEKMIDDREWKQHLPVRSIAGSNIAIIGTGDIGSTAAKKFKALGAGKVIGFSRSGRAVESFDEVYKLDDFTLCRISLRISSSCASRRRRIQKASSTKRR